MTEQNKTAIEIIYEMHGMLKHQQAQIDLLTKTISLNSDKINKLLVIEPIKPSSEGVIRTNPDSVKLDVPSPSVSTPVPESPKQVTARVGNKEVPVYEVPKPESTMKAPTPEPPKKEAIKNVRVFGHIINDNGKGIPGILVTIRNAINEVIKTTKTNTAGMWNSFLPPGKYAVEFELAGMQPEYKTFDVFRGQKELEIL